MIATPEASAASRDEQRVLSAIDRNYIWRITRQLALGGEIVAGTSASLDAARWLASEMRELGLEPGLAGDGFIEDFTIFGWEELETTVELLTPARRSIACKQYYKGTGTGHDGVTAPVVFIGEGHWEDFERVDVHDKIVLFHRSEQLFWGAPVLLEARARGAVGALMDWPVTDSDGLKTDCIAVSLPTAYIKGRQAWEIESCLERGQEVTVRLVVNNRTGHYPQAHNVLGRIPGAVRPDECVYIAAHFDHWFTSACDDCAGVGVVLGLAKAFKDSGVRPARTLVFAVFDAEELGGPDDTWYDWIMGSYSHAVATLRPDGRWGPPLHPELPGQVVAMLNLDVIGVRGGEVFCETSPELTSLMARAAADCGLSAAAPTHVYWPPGSYDDCSFFLVGIPVMQMAWFGPAYEALYHTTDDTLDKIDPANLELTAACTLLATCRLSQSLALPYAMLESARVATASLDRLVQIHPEFEVDDQFAALRPAIDGYRAAVERLDSVLAAPLSDAALAAVNQALMGAVKALGTTLYHWDFTSTPGWENLTVFDTSAHDLDCLNRAMVALEVGDRPRAAEALADVRTMGWGRDVGPAAYAGVMAMIAEPTSPAWGGPFLPFVTDVHREFSWLVGRGDPDALTPSECLGALEGEADAIRREARSLSWHLASVLTEATGILDGLVRSLVGQA